MTTRDAWGVALLVEDDPPLAAAMKTKLAALGFEVVIARDYYEGVECLATHRPRLICLELGLPNESGYAFCERVRQRPDMSNVAIVMMSESAFPAEMAQAEEVGANAFLQKPFTMGKLEAYVLAVMQQDVLSSPNIRRLRV